MKLISTKINSPNIFNKSILRQRLIDRLDQELNKPISLISAPAGFGKTTLAVQWANHIRRPAAWLSLDELDNDPYRFFTYLLASIRAVIPEFGSGFKTLRSSPASLPLYNLVDEFIFEFDGINAPLLLVLDDFHAIRSKEIQDALVRLIKHLPGSIHFLFLTRIDPLFPLTQWRIRDLIGEIRPSDLRFSTEESIKLFRQHFLNAISDKSVDSICQKIEGWPAGLRIALLSLKEVNEPETAAKNFSKRDQHIVDYLMEEIICRQPEHVKKFLAITSLFDRFCPSLLEYVLADRLEQSDVKTLMRFMRQGAFFLIPLDRENNWYRYPLFFRSLLQSLVNEDLSPEYRQLIHNRAGQWFLRQEFIGVSLEHFIAAGKPDLAANIIYERLHIINDSDRNLGKLFKWLDIFPSSEMEKFPEVLVAQSFLEGYKHDYPKMVSLVETAEVMLKAQDCQLPDKKKKMLQADMDVNRLFGYFHMNDIEKAIIFGKRAIDSVPKGHNNSYTVAKAYTAASLALIGEKKMSEALMDGIWGEYLITGTGDPAMLIWGLIGINLFSGNLSRIRKLSLQMLLFGKEKNIHAYNLCQAFYFLGIISYEYNDLEDAWEQLNKALELRNFIDPYFCPLVYMGLAMVDFVRGDVMSAKEYIISAKTYISQTKIYGAQEILSLFELRMEACSGEDHVHMSRIDYFLRPSFVGYEPPTLIWAEYLLCLKTEEACRQSLAEIERALKNLEKYQNKYQIIKFSVLKAVALATSGEQGAALDLMEKLLEICQPIGLIRTFVDRGPLMYDLLITLHQKNPENAYIKNILDGFENRPTLKKPEKQPLESKFRSNNETIAKESVYTIVTNREHDVLILLAQRITNKEIGRKMFISPETVKKHTISIFRKLNVQNRRQAVATAKKIGLLN